MRKTLLWVGLGVALVAVVAMLAPSAQAGAKTVIKIGTVVALREEISGDTIISTRPSCVMKGVTRRMMPMSWYWYDVIGPWFWPTFVEV